MLTDSLNPAEKIVFTISKKEGAVKQSCFWINGIEQDSFTGAIGAEGLNGKMSIALTGGMITDAGSKSFKLLNEEGTPFNGFSSGFVYVDYIIVNPNGNENAGIQVMSISNQNLGSVSRDRIQPNVYFLGELKLQAIKGEPFVFPTARVYDVLDPRARLYVMVTKGDEVIVERTEYYDGFTFTFNDYGKYNVVFIAVDNNNQEELEAPVLVKVYNRTAPTLELLGTPKKRIKVGHTINPLKAETDGTLTVFIVAPDGRIHIVSDGFKTTIRGVHRVIYYSCNEYNVSTLKSYEVVVE